MRAITVLLALGWYALLARIGVRATCACGVLGPLATTRVRARLAAVASGWRLLGRASDAPGAMACVAKWRRMPTPRTKVRALSRIACVACPASITARDESEVHDAARAERWRRCTRGWVCGGCLRDPMHTSTATGAVSQ